MLLATPLDLPEGDSVLAQGPSYPASFRALATTMVLAVAVLAVQQGPALLAAGVPTEIKLLAGLGGVALVGGWWSLLHARTGISHTRVWQTGWSTRSVALKDIVQVKLIRLPGLDWLVAPRLLVRAGGLAQHRFGAADPAVLAAFKALAYGDARAKD